MKTKKRRGFTFVEILITVAIIAILAATIAVSLTYVRKKSSDARRVSEIKQIAKALELYYDRYAYYPGILDELVGEKLMSFIPTPPSGSSQSFYHYVPLGENFICTGYHLGAALEIKKQDYLHNDSDAFPAVVCAKAEGRDFDGTAKGCLSDIQGEGIDGDNCYDLKM